MPAWSIGPRNWSASHAVRLQHMIPETVSGGLDQEDTPAARIAKAISEIADAFEAVTGGNANVMTQGNLSSESPAFLTLTVIPFAPRTDTPVSLVTEPVNTDAKPCADCPKS